MRNRIIAMIVVAQLIVGSLYVGAAPVLGKSGPEGRRPGPQQQPISTPKKPGTDQQQSGPRPQPTATPQKPGSDNWQPVPQPQPTERSKRPDQRQPGPQPQLTVAPQKPGSDHWQPVPQPQPTERSNRPDQRHSRPQPQPTVAPQKPGSDHWQPVPQPNNQRSRISTGRLKRDARKIMERTASILVDAQQAARQGHRYQGLATAIAHQQRAQELYRDGKYREAIYFSLRARELAFQIVKANKGKLRSEFFNDDRERSYSQEGPRSEELDRRLDKSKMGKDNAAIHIRIELNF